MMKHEATRQSRPGTPGVRHRHGRQRRRGRHGDGGKRSGRRLSDHSVHTDGRGMGRGACRRPDERERASAPVLRAGRRTRGGWRDGRDEHDRAPGDELLERPGHRLHARVAVRGGREAPHLRAQRGGPRHDQARAQRPRRPRRLPRRRRHRLLPALREGRAGSGGLQPDQSPHRRAVAEPRHLRAGRLPDQPHDRVDEHPGAGSSSTSSSATRRTSSTRRRPRSAWCSARRAAASPRSSTSTTRPCSARCRTRTATRRASPPSARSTSTTSPASPTRPSRSSPSSPAASYARAMGYRLDDAEYVIAGQGSVVVQRRGRRRLPARDARAQGRRAEPDDVPPLPRPISSRAAARARRP